MNHYQRTIPSDSSGARVFVYFNLHSGLWSVRSKATGRVLGHSKHVALINVKPKVSQAGRQRVLREQRKNVHAGLEGDLLSWGSHDLVPRFALVDPVGAFYNPYKTDRFVVAGDPSREIVGAKLAILEEGRKVTVARAETREVAHA